MSKEELRQQAAISVLNSLLETTQHSAIEAIGIKDIYAHIAVIYADSLVDALDKKPDEIKTWLHKSIDKELDWIGINKNEIYKELGKLGLKI